MDAHVTGKTGTKAARRFYNENFKESSSQKSLLLLETHRVRFVFHKGAADLTYMQMDGEPWKQPLPVDDATTVVEISHHGRVKMLVTQNCISRSVYDPSTPHSLDQHDADDVDDNWEDENTTPLSEERSMFGAADAFKIPEDVDISRLS